MILRKIFLSVAAMCAVASAAIMPEAAGYLGFSQWIPNTQADIQGKVPVAGGYTKSSSDLPLAGRTAIHVDSTNGVVYFGLPATKYVRSQPNYAAVGVPFLDVTGSLLVPDASSRLEFRVYQNNLLINLLDYRIAGFDATYRVSAQLVYDQIAVSEDKGLVPLRVNWKVSKPGTGIVLSDDGAKMVLYDGANPFEVNLAALLNTAFGISDLVLMQGGELNPDYNSGWLEFENPLYSERYPTYTQFMLPNTVNCGENDLNHACGYGTKLQLPANKWVWGEFSSVEIDYRANPGSSQDKWNLWFFDENQAPSTLFLPKDLKPVGNGEMTHISIPASEFVTNAAGVFDVDRIGSLPVSAFKVMASWVEPGATFDVASVVLRRAQPPSLRFFGVVDPSGKPTIGKLTVRVLAPTQQAPLVRLLQGATVVKSATASATSGEVTWTGIAPGDYTVVVSKDGFSYQPEAIAWNSTTSGNLVLVQQYSQRPVFSPNPPSAIALDEGQEMVVQLGNLASDPRGPGYPLAWSVSTATGDPIPFKLDPALRTLRVGLSGSDVNGTANLQLVATGSTGASATAALAVTVRPVNDAPKILATEWSVAAGSLLSVKLDSTRSGKAVWVDDPDDSYLNLTWTAKLALGAPEGAVVTVTDRKLVFQAPAGFSGPVVVDVTVNDLAGAQTTKQVTIKVVPPQVEIYGIKTEQLATGDLKATFFSRYSLESVNLQNGVIKVLNQANGAWGVMPAHLTVLQAPSFRDGRWTDGQYELTVDRSSPWVRDGVRLSLASFAGSYTSLSVKLPLAADGKVLEKDAQFTGLDLSGPVALVTASSSPGVHGEPQIHVSWNWIEAATAKSIRLTMTSGDDRHERIVPVPAGVNSVTIPWSEPKWERFPMDPADPYTRDGQEYQVELLGVDANGNEGGGIAVVTTASSGYELRITTTNLLQLPRPKGRICIQGTKGFRGCTFYDSYGGDQFTTGRILDVPRDIYTVSVEDTLYQPQILDVMPGSKRLGRIIFEHSPNYPVSRQSLDTAPDMKVFLLRKNFLSLEGVSVEQEIDTGNIVFKFDHNRFLGGILDTVLLGVTMIVDGQTRDLDFRIPVTEYDEFNTPRDLDSWTVRRSLNQLKSGPAASLFAKADHHSIRYLGAVARFSNTWNPDRTASLRDSVVYHAKSKPFAWHVLDPNGPAQVDPSYRTIQSGGWTQWRLPVSSTHGSRATLSLCLRNDNPPDTCSELNVKPEYEKLGFQPTVQGAYSVPGFVNFEEPTPSGGVRVPASRAEAASQWDVFTKQTTDHEVWIYWSTDHLSDEFWVSSNGGEAWHIQTTLFSEGWNRLGSLKLTRGWNSLTLRASQGPTVHALLVQRVGSPEPTGDYRLLPLSHAPVMSKVSNQLLLDRFYKATFTVKDAFGQESQSISGFPVQPDGLFGDVSLEQENGSGDLLIRAGQTRVDPTAGDLRIRLAPNTSAISPIIDNVDHLTLRIPRDRLPPEIRSTAGLSKGGPLDSIRILTTNSTTYTWTTRECWDGGWLGGWGCETHWHSRTDTKPDSVELQWTGFESWSSGHDVRALPKPIVSVVHAGLDSILLKVSGLDDSSGQTRQSMPGKLSVQWTPGSHCASSTWVDIPFRQIFVAGNDGTILFRPRLSSAAASGYGGWSDTTSGAPRLRHQWLDHSDGGGFFPLMILPQMLAATKRPWVSFTVRNPTLTPLQVRLWTAAGPFAGEKRQAFEFRLAPVGTPGRQTPPGVVWHYGAGFAQGWHQQADELVLQPGDQELQIRMLEAGVSFRALGLRPSTITTDPAEAIASLPYVGTQGMNEVFVSAPSLASGTLHGFRIVATDRMGNTSSDSVTVATESSAAKFPTVGIALAPWDGSGWITGSVATASFVPDGRFTLPENAEIKAWIRHREAFTGALTQDSTEVPVVKNQDGTWSATLTGLGVHGQTLQEFQDGMRTVLVAYVQSGSLRGNRSGIDFAILSEAHPGALPGPFLDGPAGKGLNFRVRQAWQQSGPSGNKYADLELTAFKVQEDDTAMNRLLLRGALVSFTTEAGGSRLTNVVGGRLAAVHCKLAGTVESGCMDVPRMPWTLGRWSGFLETESIKPILQGSSWTLRVMEAELIDDAERPSRNSFPFLLSDAGLMEDGSANPGAANFRKDRFWFRNVVASGEEEAFGIEACQTEFTRTATGLQINTMGCDERLGPFLTFPLHIQTDGPWSVVGAAFDSLENPYLLQWTPDANPGSKWVAGSPLSRGALQVQANNVNITKSSLRNVRGASLWGYDVASYSFGRNGVSNLVFDLLLPDSKLTPAQAGITQRVQTFTGMSIGSTANVMKGSPVLQGTGISTDIVPLYLGSSLRLDDVVKWTYARKDGIGWVLTPSAATTLVLSKAQDANWKYTKIGAITQADDRFRFPFTSLELGAGRYVAASSSQDVKISTGGATIQAKLNIDPNDDELRIKAATPKVILDEFFTEKGGPDFKPVTVPDPELTLDPEFGLADIEGVGSLGSPAQTAQHEVWVGGLPVVNAIPSGRYQIMANRGRLFVRLYRPQMALNGLGADALPGAPSAEVQTAVFSTDRMPVAVGAELDVPASWRDWQIPGSIGSLQLDKVYLEATAQRDVDRGNFYPAIRLSSPTVVKLGAAFEKLGLDGYKLPIKGVTMDLAVKSGQLAVGSEIANLDWTVGFETAPIGFALDLQLTRERIKTLISGSYNKASDQTPVVVRLTTQGWPVYAKYADKHLDLSLMNWEIELTKDFPIEAMRNTAFHLDDLSVQTNGTSFDVKQFQASGTKSFPDGLAITSDVKLLGSPQNPVTVTLTGRTGQSPIFTLKASKIRIGNSDYEISCPDHPTEISVSLHGDFEGDICVQTKEKISVYPLNDPDPNVWIAGGENGTIPYELRLQIKDGEFGITLRNAHLRTKEIKPVFPSGVDAIISAGVFVKDGSLRLKQGSAFLKLGDDNNGWKKEMGPFGVVVPDLRFFYNTLPADAVVEETIDKGIKVPKNFADGVDYSGKIAFVLKPEIGMNAGDCDEKGEATVRFEKDVQSHDPVKFAWDFKVKEFACELGGMNIVVQGLQLGEKNDNLTVSTQTFQVAIGEKASEFLGGGQATDASEQVQFMSSEFAGKLKGKGVRIDGLRYVDSLTYEQVRPVGLPSLDNLALEIPGIGVTVISDLDVMPLFDLRHPGFAFDNVRLALPNALGGDTLSTNFSVLFNANNPYVHVRGSMNELPLRIPGIKLTDDIGFDGARMVIRFNTRADGSEGWSFDGTAGLNLAGPIGKLNAELSVQKPDAILCRVGVCKAVVSIRLKNGSRIPLGATGLYIAGLKGAFYDGDHQPACAKKCTGVDMPRGMKVELAVFLEAQSASILKGTTGVWVQLNRINFGIYGDFQMLEGTADADACAAVFGGGKQFHGEVNVRLHTMLSVQGGFVIDIWSDNSGNNMAAEASASVGLERGAIIKSRWFKFPRSTYWLGPFVTRFGRFEGGSNGFTTGVRALGRTWGVGYVDSRFRLGNVASYRLARPNTSGKLFLAGSDYRVVPLGLQLKGGEVLSVNVGAAEGVDWRGAKLQLLMANKKGNSLTGYSIDKENLTPVAGMDDSTVTHQEDSANIHSLIYLNQGLEQRMLVAIPNVAGTAPSGEEQPVDGANLASKTDDLQVFLGLVDPTVALTAQKCGADTTTVCVSGSVVNFRKDPVEYVRTISPEEQGLLADNDYTSQKVLLQKHHLKFWAIPVWDTTGGVGARDSAIPLEIPSSELTNLATCLTALPTGQTGVALNNCQWKPGRWKSGRYGLMAGVEGEDLLPTLAVPAQQSEMFLLDQTRRILSKPGESTPLSIAVSYPDPLAPITGLAVFGSALDSAQSGTSNQRRTIFARWVAGNHPEMQGHFVRWTDSRNAQHMFHAGTAGQWNWDIPLADAYVTLESDLWDTTDTMGRVRGVQTAYQWMFEPPVKLEVAPAVLLRAPDKDSFYLSPRWDLSASWSGSNVLGRAAGGTKNGLTVATTPAMQAVELNQTKVDTLRLNVTEFDVGSTSTRVATDYAHMDLQLMGPTGQPLSEALQKAAPSVSAALESWRFGSNSLKIPLHFTARSAAQLCQARLRMKDSSWMNTEPSVCKEGDTLMPATAMGDYQVKLRIWNEGRLEAGQETVVMVPVKVTPPRPRIDRVSPDYLLGMRRQKIRLEASNLWVDAQGRKPAVALRDGQGNWVRFVANGTTTRGTERELVPDANGRVDTTFEVELGNEYNLPGVDNRLELHVFHRDAVGATWGDFQRIAYVEKPENWECRDSLADETSRHIVRTMDFVGFYPKKVGLRDTVTALFSEIHNPDFVTWKVRVEQDTNSSPAEVVDVDAGRVRFVLPEWVRANEKITLVLNIPDNSAGASCKDKNWSQTLTTAPAVGGSNVPRQLKASAQSGASLVSFPNLLPDQRFEWVRGNPPQGWAWNWIQGMPTTTDVPQTDWLNLRLRRPEAGVQWQAKWLVVTPPREISLATTARTLRRRDTLPAGTNLAWSLAPVATRGRNGTSVPVMQCRWNDAVWETCAEQSLKVDLQRQGALELRLGWKLFLPVGDTMVWEPVQSWSLSVRPTNLDNVERVTLRLDGQRLAHLIDGQVTKTVLRVRRSGTELSRWDATAPVVRDVSGQILPQQTEVWDPVAKRYEAWVEVADLAPNRSVTLELWLNDKSPVQAPSTSDAWHGSSSSAGTIGSAVAAAGQKQSVSLPASAMRGWTSSLWLRWNPDAAETVWSSTPLEWGTRTNGSLWLKYRGDSVVSAPGVLDAQGPMLVGASWEVPSGRLSLWANGQRLASKMVAAQDERVVDPATVQVGGRYAVDELRWSQVNTTAWKLRWESERPGSKLWEPWTSMAPVAPHVLESRGAVGDTLSLVTGAPVWADREAQVTSVPAAWAGAAWLPGLAFRAKDTALQAAWIRAERFAQVCAVGDASWQPRTGWTRQSTDLSTSLGARAVWCHPLPSEVSGLPGPRDAQTASQTALSWFVLPTTGTTTPVVIQPGQNLDGWTLPATLPTSLAGASLPNTVKSPDGTLVDSRRPGGFMVLVPLAQFLPSMGTVVDTVWVRKVDGSNSQVLVVWTETVPKIDSIRVLVAPPRAVVPRDPSASWKIFTSKDSVKLPDGSTPRWDMPAPVLGPRTCEERVFEANFRRPSELWLALPPGVRTQALLGWKSVGEVALGGKTWTQWTRSIEPGRFTWDASLVFGEGTCASFLLVAVERWRNLPDWTLPSVRLGAVGGSAVLQGGIHRIKNLEIQHAAALYLHSQQYSMKLLSATGLGQKLVSSVLSLGVPQIKELRDPETGLPEYVQVSSQFALHDLRADLLDADSVKVDLRNLRASGKARLTVTQYGATRFVGGIYAVLFRDRNGDMRYTAGADDLIGMEDVGSIGAGESVKIDFALDQHSRNFPEEVFMAWIDAGAVSPERKMGDHVALGGNPCREVKATRWLDASKTLTRPNGAVVVKVHLRDTDHDNLVRDRDSMDVLWYQAGKVCRAVSLDADALWCVAAPSVGSNSDLSVTDLDADGVPEIVAGNTVLRRDGTVLWSAENFTGTTWSDFDADGRTDTLRGSSTCHTVIAGTGEVLWSQGAGCASTGRYPKLSAILAHPEGCADVSVSGIQVRAGAVWVRVANSGTTTLPAGIVLVRTNADGTVERNRVVTTQPLAAGAFEDMEIGTDTNLTDRIQVLPGALRDLGVWEFSTRNNRGNLSGELRP